MAIDNYRKFFDLEENDYFYHMTGKDNAERIMNEGLLVNGNNILNTDNILFTTSVPIDEELLEDFDSILQEEMGHTYGRDTDACVIIGAPKMYDKQIVENYHDEVDGVYYEGIINNDMIMGFFDLTGLFHANESYEYGTDEFYNDNEYFDDYYEGKRIR